MDIKALEERIRKLEYEYSKDITESQHLVPIISHYKMLYQQETGKEYVQSKEYIPIIRAKHFCN